MEFIEYRGFKNVFFGLVRDETKEYFILYGKTKNISLNFENNIDKLLFETGHMTKYITNYKECHAEINIPFCNNENMLFKLIKIFNKEVYTTLVEVMEQML